MQHAPHMRTSHQQCAGQAPLPCHMRSSSQQRTGQQCQATMSAAHAAHKAWQQPANEAPGNSINPSSPTEAEKGELMLYIEDRSAQAESMLACCVLTNATLITAINTGRKQEIPEKKQDL